MPKRVELLTWNLNLNGCPIFYLATLRCRVGEAETQKWWGGSMQTSLEEEKGKNYRTVIPAHSLRFFVEDRGLEPWFLEIPSSLWGSQSSPLYFLWEANWSHSSINSNISRMLSQVPTLALHHEPQDRCRSCPYSVDGLMEKTQVKWVNC